jgi:hypothetical protein
MIRARNNHTVYKQTVHGSASIVNPDPSDLVPFVRIMIQIRARGPFWDLNPPVEYTSRFNSVSLVIMQHGKWNRKAL